MDQKFHIGDSVVLKIGSSPKVVLDDKLGEDKNGMHYFDGTYQCAWYDANQDIKIEIISQDDLSPTRKLVRSF
jgi:uncharacterized protein YodC (DUF2158 family)